MNKLAFVFAFLVAPVFAQDRLILECDVERRQDLGGRGWEKNDGRDRIQIDLITPDNLPADRRNWFRIAIKGSEHFDLSAWLPPPGESYDFGHTTGKNQSNESMFLFYGKDEGRADRSLSYWLEIDRITGLLQGSISTTNKVTNIWVQTRLSGHCKKVDSRARKF